MHRQPLLTLLKNYHPIDEKDREQWNVITKFVEDNKNCFERSNLKGHITGSSWVVNSAGTKVILNHHKKLGKWLQLGGHADGNPNVLSVALREAQEETGLQNFRVLSPEIFDVDVHLIPERKKEPAHIHYDIRFLFEANDSLKLNPSNESHALQWVQLKNLSKVSTEPSLHRMLSKWMNFSTPI